MTPDKVEKLCQRAQQAIAERDWEKAKQVYLTALGLRGDLPDVHYGLATVYFQLRELTSASHHFKEVTRLDPLRASAFINLGAVMNLLHQYDDAVVALRRGLQLDNTRVEGYYNLGLVYRRKNQLDLSIQAYREAIRLNPRMADAHYNLGNLYLDRNQVKVAVTHYEEAAKLRPGWEKAQEGLERARAVDTLADAKGVASEQAAPAAKAHAADDVDRLIDPVHHGVYLSHLHQAAIVAEESGRLLQQVVATEVEPAIKELSTALLNSRGSRSELEACLAHFEAAMGRMKSAHETLKGKVTRIGELDHKFPV
ncbi:MAG: tetratricopeptide repeat protein [Gemmataceae bacterium]